MKVSIDARALSSASSVLPLNGRIGSLTTIQADAEKQKLFLRTNSKTTMIDCEVAMDAKVDRGGIALVSTDGFRDVTRRSSGVAVMKMEDNRLVYSDDTCTIKLGVSSKSQEQPSSGERRTSGVVSAALLAKALRLGRCAGPNDSEDEEKMKKFGCVQLLLHDHQLEVASMDGPQMALVSTTAKADSPLSASISAEQAAWLSKALAIEEDRLIEIGTEGGNVAFYGTTFGALLRTTERGLPDWRRSIPPSQPCKMKVKPGEIHGAIDRLRAIGPSSVEIRISEAGMVIAGKNNSNEGEIKIEAMKSDEPVKAGKIRVSTGVLALWDRAVAQSNVTDSISVEFGLEKGGMKIPVMFRAGCATLIATPWA